MNKKLIALASIGTIIIIATILAIIFILPTIGKPYVLKYNETGEKSDYRLEIIKENDIENTQIKSWLEKSQKDYKDDNKYFTLNNNLPLGMDIYVYIPAVNQLAGNIKKSDITIKEEFINLQVFIDTNDDVKRTLGISDMILHIYHKDKVEETSRYNNEQIYINGENILRVGSPTFRSIIID